MPLASNLHPSHYVEPTHATATPTNTGHHHPLPDFQPSLGPLTRSSSHPHCLDSPLNYSHKQPIKTLSHTPPNSIQKTPFFFIKERELPQSIDTKPSSIRNNSEPPSSTLYPSYHHFKNWFTRPPSSIYHNPKTTPTSRTKGTPSSPQAYSTPCEPTGHLRPTITKANHLSFPHSVPFTI